MAYADAKKNPPQFLLLGNEQERNYLAKEKELPDTVVYRDKLCVIYDLNGIDWNAYLQAQ